MSAGATQDDDRLGPGVRVGSYLIERRLGAGGMGSVFAARHVGLDKPVALKTLHPTLASREAQVVRFVREGRAASRIRHPHVVDVTDVGTHEGIPFLVMEYLDGEDLQTRLESCHLFTPTELARILLPVIDAVAAAHDKGVVHRDLKPSNVFLERGPHGVDIPKVLDFGIAKILDTEEVSQKTITQAAMFLGTPYYASPEQAQSGSSADARSDQYSIGAMMYQLATGRVPVQGATPFEVLCAIVAGGVTPIRVARPDVLPELAAIVERAMAFRPADRFASLRELGAALLPLAEPIVRAQWEPAFRSAGSARTYASHGDGASPLPPSDPAISSPAPDPADIAFAATIDSSTSVVPPTVVGEAPRRSRAAVIVGASLAGLACAGLAAGGLWWWTQHRSTGHDVVAVAQEPRVEPPLDDETGSAAASAPAPAATAAPSVEDGAGESLADRVEIVVEPPTAAIEIDGEAAGVGSASLPRDGQPHTVRVSADGYRERELRVAPRDDQPLHITLQPADPPPETERASPAPRPRAPAPSARPLSPSPRPFGGRPSTPARGWGRSRPPVGNNRAPILD